MEHFTYLGGIISNDATVSKDLDNHLSKATISCGRLSKTVGQSHSLRLSTKIQLYGAVVAPTLLGSLSEADQATGVVSLRLLALHPWHQMARPYVERRSPQENQPAQHTVHLASGASALGWPRHKDGRHRQSQNSLLQQAPRMKAQLWYSKKSL